MKTGIKIIDKYVSFYDRKIKSMGFNMSIDDLSGELGLVYSNCLKTYRENNESKAKFETYVISAFKYKINDIVENLLEESRSVSIEQAEKEVFNIACFESPDDEIMFKANVKEIMDEISNGRRLLIFKELIEPSEKVINMVSALKSHRCHVKNPIVWAISLVYGFKQSCVKKHIYIVKNIAKNKLTEN